MKFSQFASLVLCAGLLGLFASTSADASIKHAAVKPGGIGVGNYACPSGCPGPRGPYTTSCSGTVCLSNPTPSSESLYN